MHLAISPEEIRDLSVGVVFANTPGSLASWLANQPAVARLADACDENELLNHIVVHGSTPIRTDTSTTIAYATIAALALQRRRRGGSATAPFDLSALPWAAHIWTKLIDSPSTTTVIIDAPSASVAVAASFPSPQILGGLVDEHGRPLTSSSQTVR